LPAEEIPLQARMMTVADIFDALTASDRPYKKAVPVGLALDILRAEQRQGKLDADVLALFIEARIFAAEGEGPG
jgi:HD-GYP domain-containing protein (c-di-GMP phosphodiesterase class II)